MAGRAENRPSTRRVWYVNRNVRFMFNYLHGDIAKQVSATDVGDVGAKFDAFAVRTHIAFWTK
jgi:phosphate-selective porin OprO/OprP